jgi:hypothetical protein
MQRLETKPGIKTTEFWLGLILPQIVALLMAFGVFTPEQGDAVTESAEKVATHGAELYAAIISGLSALGYNIGRGKAKQGVDPNIVRILAFLLVFALPVVAFANPFLVCDPDPDATSYLVKLDGLAEVETPAPLKFDLAGVSVGNHRVEVKAKNNLWGATSEASPFEFSRPSLSVTNIRLSAD